MHSLPTTQITPISSPYPINESIHISRIVAIRQPAGSGREKFLRACSVCGWHERIFPFLAGDADLLFPLLFRCTHRLGLCLGRAWLFREGTSWHLLDTIPPFLRWSFICLASGGSSLVLAYNSSLVTEPHHCSELICQVDLEVGNTKTLQT